MLRGGILRSHPYACADVPDELCGSDGGKPHGLCDRGGRARRGRGSVRDLICEPESFFVFGVYVID
jgi:hypothetical protein